jgi:hypothetical protein
VEASGTNMPQTYHLPFTFVTQSLSLPCIPLGIHESTYPHFQYQISLLLSSSSKFFWYSDLESCRSFLISIQPKPIRLIHIWYGHCFVVPVSSNGLDSHIDSAQGRM